MMYTQEHTEQGWTNSKRSILEQVMFEQSCPGEAVGYHVSSSRRKCQRSIKDSIKSSCFPPRGPNAEKVSFLTVPWGELSVVW